MGSLLFFSFEVFYSNPEKSNQSLWNCARRSWYWFFSTRRVVYL